MQCRQHSYKLKESRPTLIGLCMRKKQPFIATEIWCLFVSTAEPTLSQLQLTHWQACSILTVFLKRGKFHYSKGLVPLNVRDWNLSSKVIARNGITGNLITGFPPEGLCGLCLWVFDLRYRNEKARVLTILGIS